MRNSGLVFGFVLNLNCCKCKPLGVPLQHRNIYRKTRFRFAKSFGHRLLCSVNNNSPTVPPEIDLFSVQVEPHEYTVLGLAYCFQRNSSGKLQELIVIEPIPSSTLETVLRGVPTSYKRLVATTYEAAKDVSLLPPSFVEDERVSFCEGYLERLQAATRTYRARRESRQIQPGEIYQKTNFSTSPKRVLNEKFEPSFEDNVKQDISIDVYGRTKGDVDVKKQIEDLYNA